MTGWASRRSSHDIIKLALGRVAVTWLVHDDGAIPVATSSTNLLVLHALVDQCNASDDAKDDTENESHDTAIVSIIVSARVGLETVGERRDLSWGQLVTERSSRFLRRLISCCRGGEAGSSSRQIRKNLSS